MNKKKILILLLIIFVFFQSFVYADNFNIKELEKKGIVLKELNTGEIIYSNNYEKKYFPASTTKLMTALLAVEFGDLDDEITIGKEIFQITKDSSRAHLILGEKITLYNLLHALLLPSGNDAANTIAVYIARKVSNEKLSIEKALEEFISLMNKKAEELSANNTHFVNTHGLHTNNHYTTIKDMLVITEKVLEFDVIKEIIKKNSYNITSNKTKHKWINTNLLIHKKLDSITYIKEKGENVNYSPYVTGVKTGYTEEAGRCLIFTVEKNDLDLLGIIFNSDLDNIYKEANEFINYMFNNYKIYNFTQEGKLYNSYNIDNSHYNDSNELKLIAKENFSYLVNLNELSKFKELVLFNDNKIKKNEKNINLQKNIVSNEIVAKLVIMYNNDKLREVPLYSLQTIHKKNYKDFIKEYWVILFILLLMLFTFIIIIINRIRISTKEQQI